MLETVNLLDIDLDFEIVHACDGEDVIADTIPQMTVGTDFAGTVAIALIQSLSLLFNDRFDYLQCRSRQ